MTGPRYVRAHSSGAASVSTRVMGPIPNSGRAFAWQGHLLPLDGIPASALLPIADVKGHVIREIPVGDAAGGLTLF